MTAKIIDPKTGVTIRVIQGVEDLEDCLLKMQEEGGEPLVLQLGGSGKMLHIIPC